MSIHLKEIDATEENIAQQFYHAFEKADLTITTILGNVIALKNTPEANELKNHLELLEKTLPTGHAKTLFLAKIADDKIANRPAKIYSAVQALQTFLNPSDAQKLDAFLQSLFNLAIQLKATSKGLTEEFTTAFDTEQSESTPEIKSTTFLEKLFSTSTSEQKSTSTSVETSRLDFLSHDGLSKENIKRKNELHRRDRLKTLQEARKIVSDDGLSGDSHDKRGFSTLTYLVLNGFPFLARSFMSLNNPDIGHRDKRFGITALHWAAYKGENLSVRYLLEFIPKGQVDFLNASPEAGFGLTPLMAAAHGGYLDVVKLLLAAGARLEIRDIYGQTALSHATKQNQTHVVDFLTKLQALGVPQSSSTSAADSKNQQKNDFLTPQQRSFLAFGEENPTGTLKEQEKRQEEQENVEKTAHELIAAIKDGNSAVLKKIFDVAKKAKHIIDNQDEILQDPKRDGKAILATATQALKEFKKIINYVSNKNRTPWLYAVQEDNAEAMALLAQYGADVNGSSFGNTCLHLAAYKNNAEAIETLFSPVIQKQLKGTYLDIEKRNDNGDTALEIAASNGNLEATIALLAAGANYQTRNSHYKTPLDIANNMETNDQTLKEKRREVAKRLREFQEEQTKGLTTRLGFDIAKPLINRAQELVKTQEVAEADAFPAADLILEYFDNQLMPASFIKGVNEKRSKKLLELVYPTIITENKKRDFVEKYGDERWENIREIEKSVDLGTDLSAVDHRGANILPYLIENGYLSLTHKVLQILPDLHLHPQDTIVKCNSLHWAANKGNPAIMRMLLETLKKTEQLASLIDVKNDFERTPLMLAIYRGNFEVAKLLIAAGADFREPKNKEGQSAYDMAKGQTELTDFMDAFGEPAILMRDEKSAKFRLTKQQKVLIHGMFTDIIPPPAADLFQGETRERFEQQCRERNSQELAQALKDGDKEEVARLTIPPKPAAKDKDVKETKEVTPPAPWFGFDPHYKDHNELTLLHLAAIAGDDKLVFNLIDKHKVNIMTADKDGNTALHLAVFHDRSRVIETLLKADASLKNIPNSQGLTPLALAQAPEHPRLRAAHIIEHFKPKKPVAEAKGSESDAETLAHEEQPQESAKSSGFMAGFARIFKKSKEEPKEKPKEEPAKKKDEPKPSLTSTTTSLN